MPFYSQVAKTARLKLIDDNMKEKRDDYIPTKLIL